MKKILAVDIGTGTQDILLFDSRLDIENGYKLVLPSPTMMIHRRIEMATRKSAPIVLTGYIMGGGPSAWAAEEHVRAGLETYATPDAARSFNDDLTAVEATGIRVISEDEAKNLPEYVERIELRDFDYPAIRSVFERFGVSLDDLSAVAVAVFDHGNAPPEISDRQFRFDYLDERIRAENRLSAFAYPKDRIPAIMTRLRAVADSAGDLDAELIVMDSAPAAVLGATFDPLAAARDRVMIANVGNFHTLAFRLGPAGIEGVFEHHTGLITLNRLEMLLRGLADGSLTHQDVFDDHGHGALVYSHAPLSLDRDPGVIVTGPRRSLMRGSSLRPYFAVPFGDMMTAGCIGLLAACADVLPDTRSELLEALNSRGTSGTAPWDVD